MRRWVCVVAMLFGFAGDGYAWTIRPRIPVAIERPLEGSVTTAAWWRC